MSQPQPPVNHLPAGYDYKQAVASVDQLSQLVTGNENLVTQPGLVQALQSGRASDAQAGAINQFMTGLNAWKKMQLASTSGTKVPFSPEEQTALDAMGANYHSVQYTQQDALTDTLDQLHTQGYTAKMGPDGKPVLDAQGNLQLVAVEQPKEHHGWSLGRVAHDVLHNPVTSGLGAGYNVLSQNVGGGQDFRNPFKAQTWKDAVSGKDQLNNAVAASQENSGDMIARGYDPSNPFSVLAFQSRGYAHSDTSDIAADWDQQNPKLFGLDGPSAVEQAKLFLSDPEKYRQQIENDQSLTPEQIADRVNLVGSKQFQDLTRRVNAKTAGIGNQTAQALGIDPVKHPKDFMLVSAGTDLVASFLVDPVIVAGKVNTALKVRSIGLKNLGDSERIASILDPATAGAVGYRASAQRGVQYMVDQGNKLRAATNDVDRARIIAETRATNPKLAGLLEDFTGATQATGRFDQAGKMILEKGEALDTYGKAVEYLTSKNGLLRLQSGRAAAEATMMPGALSRFGFARVRGTVSGAMAARSAQRAEQAAKNFIRVRDAGGLSSSDAMAVVRARSAVDPAAESAVKLTEAELLRTQPSAADAVAKDGTVIGQAEEISADEAGGLASARRALDITPAERGMVAYNLRRFGQATAPESGLAGVAGWARPAAVAARTRLAATRWSTMLPTDTRIALDGSANAADKVYKFALTYLSRGDANILAAQFVNGDQATRRLIVSGLGDQVMHAAGLTRTQAGRDALTEARTRPESYSHAGDLTVDGNPVALHGGQMITSITLPSFTKLRRESAKIGLFEGFLFRPFGTEVADQLKSILNLGMLFKPSTTPRNVAEPYMNAALRGELGDVLRAKALSNEILRGTRQGRAAATDKVLRFGPLGVMGSFYRHILGVNPDRFSEELRWVEHDITPDDLGGMLDNLANAQIASDLNNAATGAAEIADAGFAPVAMRFDLEAGGLAGGTTRKGLSRVKQTRVGFTEQSLDGFEGANRYAQALRLRVDKTPGVAKAALEAVRNPGGTTLEDVVRALDDEPLMKQSGFGRLMPDPKNPSGDWIRATTEDERNLSKVEWAQKVVNDFRYMVTGQNGQLQHGLIDHIVDGGTAPDAPWVMKNLVGHNRPSAALSAEYAAVPRTGPAEGVKALMDAIIDTTGNGYKWMVDRPINRIVNSPVFLAYYGKARKGLEETMKSRLLESGLTEESANAALKDLATQQAWMQAKNIIDDPGLRSQMDTVGRNFIAFPRASREMVRRWGATLWQDPTRARKIMLSLEAAKHSGVVYTDQNGELTFTYPGSGVMMDVMSHLVSHVPGFGNLATFPVAGDMTGKVTALAPGMDNPLRFSMSPLINIPMREVTKLFPERQTLWTEIDTALNGSVGSGRGALDEITPGIARGFFQAFSHDERSSMLASSMVSAIANLYAADPDGSKGLVPPPNASSVQVDRFMGHLKAQVRNQLFMRAAFGLVAPAAPSSPSEATDGSGEDYAFHLSGIRGLDEEFKALLNDVHGDFARANTIWTAMHPDKLVYGETGSQATVSKATLPATAGAMKWMESNLDFLHSYKSVAAYFLPDAPGEYDQAAYRAQLELGIRQKKTPQEFYEQARVASAERVYYQQQDDYNAKVQAAQADGNDAMVSAYKDKWSKWASDFRAANPLFGAKTADYAQSRVNAQDQLQSLRDMIHNGDVPPGHENLQKMIDMWDSYQAWHGQQSGGDAVTKARVSNAAQLLNDRMANLVKGDWQLRDLYNGVFRSLDSNLPTLSEIEEGGSSAAAG